MSLQFKYKLKIEIQKAVSYCLFPILGTILWLIYKLKFNYSVENLDLIREKYQTLIKQSEGPILLCTNHLTLIDSIIQVLILNSYGKYLLNFKMLPWNLPEKKNFYHKWSWRLLCYLGKCIPVERMAGPENAKHTQNQIQYLLDRQEIIAVFPEGKRSRTGLIDDVDFSYATGEFLKKYMNATVICVYLRGIKNGGFGSFPAKNEHFYINIKSFKPSSQFTGLKRVRDISSQIISELKTMEKEYFQ